MVAVRILCSAAVSCVGFAPSRSICCPLGDHRGEPEFLSRVVTCARLVPPLSHIQISSGPVRFCSVSMALARCYPQRLTPFSTQMLPVASVTISTKRSALSAISEIPLEGLL